MSNNKIIYTWWPSLTSCLDKNTPMNLVPPIMRIFLVLDAETIKEPFGCHVFLFNCNQNYFESIYSLVSSTQQDKIQVLIKQRLCSINIVIAMHEMKVIMMCK